MDPLTYFPPEIVHKIWGYLRPEELLSARAVSGLWLESITSCSEAWETEFSRNWDEYIDMQLKFHRWKVNRFRRLSIFSVQECVCTEDAVYVLFPDRRLEMYSPSGETIRTFEKPVQTLHKGNNCLYLETKSASSNKVLVVDLLLNVIEELDKTQVIQANANGCVLCQNGQIYVTIQDHVQKIRTQGDYYILENALVSVYGELAKSVDYLDVQTGQCRTLSSFTSSPRCIPHVTVVIGPANMYCVFIDQREFGKVFVYQEETLVFQLIVDPWIKCQFTRNYFLLLGSEVHGLVAYHLDSFELYSPGDIFRKLEGTQLVTTGALSPIGNVFIGHEIDNKLSDNQLNYSLYSLPDSRKLSSNLKTVKCNVKGTSNSELVFHGAIDFKRFSFNLKYGYYLKYGKYGIYGDLYVVTLM